MLRLFKKHHHRTGASTSLVNLPTVSRHLLQKEPLRALDQLRGVPPGFVAVSHCPTFAAIVTEPELVRVVLSDPNGCFHKSPSTLRLHYAIGDGTSASRFPPDGSPYYAPFFSLEELRAHKRRAILPAFYAKLLASYSKAIDALVLEAFQSWQHGDVRDVYTEVHDLMLRIMIVCLFNREAGPEVMAAGRRLRLSSDALNRQLRHFFPPLGGFRDRGQYFLPTFRLWLPDRDGRSLRRRRKSLHAMVEYLLSAPPKEPGRTDDLLHLLVPAGEKSDGEVNNIEQVRNSLISLWFAGYENSASAAAWTLWCLAQHPEAQERVAAELNDPRLAGASAFTSVHQASYLRACINESLRLYPPVWSTAREVTEDTQLGAFTIPARSILVVSPWLQQHRPAAWPEPDTFRPERFLNQPLPSPGDYFPFGAGLHSCPGEAFARLELTLTIAAILKKWQVEPAPGHDPPQPMLAVTQRPKAGVFLEIKERSAHDDEADE